VTALVSYAAGKWPMWFGGHTAPAIESVILSGGPGHRRRALVFLLPSGHTRPAVVLKVAFSSEEAVFLAREFRALSEVRRDVDPSIQVSIPEPLSLDRVGEVVVLASRALEGRRLVVPGVAGRGSLVASYLMRRFLARAFTWSGDLARTNHAAPEGDESDLVDVVERFARLYPSAAAQGSRVSAFALAVGRARIRWRPSWQHRDIAVGNVISHRGVLRFLDWEHASAHSEPWFDVAYAPGTLTLLAQRQNRVASVRTAALAVLGVDAWAGSVLRREMERAWSHPLPLAWAVALVAMSTALRRQGDGREGWSDWGELALCLVADHEFRSAIDWLAPQW
jgi:hypothetical protein